MYPAAPVSEALCISFIEYRSLLSSEIRRLLGFWIEEYLKEVDPGGPKINAERERNIFPEPTGSGTILSFTASFPQKLASDRFPLTSVFPGSSP